MSGMGMSGDSTKFMAGVERLPGGGYHYPHGGFDGHILPGCFFLVRPAAFFLLMSIGIMLLCQLCAWV
jgi:hypothetical protein